MPLLIPNTTTKDDYDLDTTFAGSDVFAGGYFTVANNPCAVQLAVGGQGQASWQDEQYLPPATYPIIPGSRRPVSGLRFKSFILGSPAQIFGGLVYPGEPAIQAGTPYTATVAASGAVTPTEAQLQLIGDISLAAPAPNFDFSGIPNTYAHLMLRMYLRHTAAVPGLDVVLRFNGDATNTYMSETLQAFGGPPASFDSGAALVSACRVGSSVGATAPANMFSSVTVDIPNYLSTTGSKAAIGHTAHRQGVGTPGTLFESDAGVWTPVAAINRITVLSLTAGNFDTGSRVSLYGMTA